MQQFKQFITAAVSWHIISEGQWPISSPVFGVLQSVPVLGFTQKFSKCVIQRILKGESVANLSLSSCLLEIMANRIHLKLGEESNLKLFLNCSPSAKTCWGQKFTLVANEH